MSMWNSSRIHLKRWLEEAASEIPGASLVLDAGAGNAPYAHLFEHTRYETADFLSVNEKCVEPTYVCDLRSIPVPDERFDLVICTQVLEHVPEPLEVLRELHRVLKPGKQLWLSAPLFFAEHGQPYDFFRYTQFGLRHLAKSAGFDVLEMEWLEGFYGTLSYQLSVAGRSLTPSSFSNIRGPKRLLLQSLSVPLRTLFLVLSMVFSGIDATAPLTDRGMCKNYRCILEKPLEPKAETTLPR